MRMLIAIAIGALLVGCSASVKTITCNDIEKPAVTFVSQSVVMGLCTCASEAQVEAFVVSKIPANIQNALCPASGMKAGGPIGALVCAPVINALAGMGCSQIPSCTGANLDGAALAALVTKCQSSI